MSNFNSHPPVPSPRSPEELQIRVDAIEDVIIDFTTLADGDVLQYDATNGVYVNAPGGGGGGGGFTRNDTLNITTASLAALATEVGTLDITSGVGALIKIVSNKSAWVRFYSTSAARTADAGRSYTVDPAPGVGCIADFLFPAGGSTIPVSPPMILTNLDSTPDTIVYYSVQNRSGSTTAVSVTLTVLPMEA